MQSKCNIMNYISAILNFIFLVLLSVAAFYWMRLKDKYQQALKKNSELRQENELLLSSCSELKNALWRRNPVVQNVQFWQEQGENQLLHHVHTLSKEESEALIAACNDCWDDKVKQAQTDFPQLSSDDLLLCCLVRMQVSVACISIFMSKEIDSIYKKKLRIKKKMGLEKSRQTLDEFLSQAW